MKTSMEHINAIKNVLKQTGTYDSKPVRQIREEMAEAAKRFPLHDDVRIQKAVIGRINGEWVSPATLSDDNQVILYFHGGGFISGSCEFYRDFCSRIAKASGVKVLNIEYRLAPEHPYPAANDDCLDAYRWLLTNGYASSGIVIGGDSVGGCLALMTLIALREAGEEIPAGAFLLSPHTDLVHLDGDSYRSRAELDPTGSMASSHRILNEYLGNASSDLPILSPLRMNVEGLPALLIQVGDHEVLLSDALRFADRAQNAGAHVELEVWDNMWSAFQLLAYMLPEAQQAIANIGRFVQNRLNGNPAR